MTTAKQLAAAIESFGALLVLFVVHRLLAFSPLNTTELPLLLMAQALTVGVLSDVWVACVAAVLIFSVSAVLSLLDLPTWARLARFALLLIFATAFAAHQSYVDFYHAQFAPFHARYLVDPDFIAANGASLFALKPAVVFIAFLVPFALLVRTNLVSEDHPRALAYGALAMMSLGLIAHNRNIHLRTQWFVQDALQVNAVEHLYLKLKNSSVPRALSSEELQELATLLGTQAPLASAIPSTDEMLALITQNPNDDRAVDPLAVALKAAFTDAVASGTRPLIMVALLESLRPSETGLFPGSKPGLTPRLDAAAQTGILFTNAYSTGSVTRGGQEAAFCGYLGSRETSLMRGHTTLKVPCLPDIQLARVGGVADAFWYHGGEGRFDNQLPFWKSRGITDTLALADFPTTAARSDWGIGDLTFFNEVGRRVGELQRRSQARFLFGMALSVSNHIPWALPSDAAGLPIPGGLTHPSYATTWYSDHALGSLFDSLRAQELWDKSLLIVASDHGNNVEPYADLDAGSAVRAQKLRSHIVLMLVGGLVEKALAATGQTSVTLPSVVSQADVAALIAYLVDLRGARFMAENPLALHRRLPVVSILEDELFDPATGAVYPQKTAAKLRMSELPAERHPAILYFRAFLQLINAGSGHVAARPE